MSRRTGAAARFSIAVALTAVVTPAAAAPPAAEPEPPFRVTAPSPGRLDVSAKGAKVAEVLEAMGREGGFEVVMDADVERPPLWATVADASVDGAVRRVLRRRSYALVYAPDGGLERVIVLSPPDPQAEERRKAAEARRQQAQRLEERRLRATAARASRIGAVR